MNSSELTPDPSVVEASAESRPPTSLVDPTDNWPPLPVSQRSLPSFPLSALPTALREDAQNRAGGLQVSPDAVILPMLAAIGTAAAKRVGIRVGRVTYPTHLWAIVPMESGGGKSPLLESIVGPYQRVQAHEREVVTAHTLHHRVQSRMLRRQRGILEKELLALQALPADQATDTEEERLGLEARLVDIERQLDDLMTREAPSLLCEDVTSQALVHLLASNQGSLLLASAEASVFFRSIGGSTLLGQHVEAVLKAYSHEDIYVHRVSRPGVMVSKPALGMVLATQPVVLRSILRSHGFHDRGLWERFLYVSPPSTIGHRRPVGSLDHPGVGYYDRRVEDLLRRPVSNEPQQVLRFEPRAETIFNDYCVDVDNRMTYGDLALDPMRGWAAKLRSNLIRLSAVLHLASEGGEHEVEVRTATVQDAISLLEVAVHHARYVLVELPQEDDDETYLLRQLQQTIGPITRRDLHRQVQVRFRKADLLQDTLDRLADKGLIRVQEERHSHGQPTHWVHLHPGLPRTGRTP